jgi:bacterioferritin
MNSEAVATHYRNCKNGTASKPRPPKPLDFRAAFAETSEMQGNPKVIAALNEALKEELTAINQYFLHAEMCENWHYDKLGRYIKKQSMDEMKHAEALIERILFLDATPNLTELMKLTVGQNVKEQIQSDLKLEIQAVALYNRAVQIARDEGDNTSRELFERLLKDEEDHVDWLEAQVHQIGEMGYERYLSQQIREEK